MGSGNTGDTGDIAQHINLAKGFHGFGYQGSYRSLIRNICHPTQHRYTIGHLILGFEQAALGDINKHNGCPFATQPECGCPPDTTSGPGDDCHSLNKSPHEILPR
jgi:hypothetical protein